MVVEAVIQPVIGQGADPEAVPVDREIEASVLRPERIVVAQMPLAEMGGSVAIVPEGFRHVGQIATADGAALRHCGCPVAKRRDPGQQLAARRGAHRGNVMVREPHAFRPEPVEVRCAQPRITVRPEITIAEIISQDEDHVGPVFSRPEHAGQVKQHQAEAELNPWPPE